MRPLIPLDTELYYKENAVESRTEMYDMLHSSIPCPILRRGCTFFFAVRMDREFVPYEDIVRVKFAFGPKPKSSLGTRAILEIDPAIQELPHDLSRWSICLNSVEGDVISVKVQFPARTPVGIWKCSLQTNVAGRREKRRVDYEISDDIYLLYNPWCPEDDVYMDNKEEINEYVLNDTGKIYCGTFKNPVGLHWVFGQFDEAMLPAVMLLLDKSGLSYHQWGNPVLVTRALSALINSNNDDGLLEGRWDGEYGEGTSPFAWSGSPGIMRKYLHSGGEPVKYGQCWVFSGVTVTVCRALGIPCRATTNYVSAHDTNKSMTVDKYFDIDGHKIEDSDVVNCNDSLWNFHVWNDVWMTRPDLPHGYGGWQIIDATPQETSGQLYRCGPASVSAIKNGEVGLLYDSPFIFSEVNADIVHFKQDERSDWGFSRILVNKYHVGRMIVTKQIGFTDPEGDSDIWNVTEFYKNPENTIAERLAVYNAVHGIPDAQKIYEIPSNADPDIFLDLVDIEAVPLGDSFDVVVKIENNSMEERTVSALISLYSVLYTGATVGEIKKAQGILTVQGGTQDTLQVQVTPDDYLDKLADHGLIKVYAIASVEETRYTWSEEDDFTMRLPPITIAMPESCIAYEPCDIQISFRNPLNIPLTNCVYTVEGQGLHNQEIVDYRDIDPQEEALIGHSFTPMKSGVKKLVFSFTSRQIQNMTISATIHVVDNPNAPYDQSVRPNTGMINMVERSHGRRHRRSVGSGGSQSEESGSDSDDSS